MKLLLQHKYIKHLIRKYTEYHSINIQLKQEKKKTVLAYTHNITSINSKTLVRYKANNASLAINVSFLSEFSNLLLLSTEPIFWCC